MHFSIQMKNQFLDPGTSDMSNGCHCVGSVPVHVITTSICRMTSLSLTTRNPSMLCDHTKRVFCFFLVKNRVNQTKCQRDTQRVLTSQYRMPLPVTHHACRAQMGSISVMHTMAPRALRAVQHPFPTYGPVTNAFKPCGFTLSHVS